MGGIYTPIPPASAPLVKDDGMFLSVTAVSVGTTLVGVIIEVAAVITVTVVASNHEHQ